ncbi:LysM peptidoglycan-binding domain-containing protein [Periweissella fabalis]
MKKMFLTGTGLVAAMISTGVVANADSIITVHQGDTVSKLAKENNTTIEAIVNANKLTNANLIFVNQKLTIPSTNTQAPVQKQAPVQQAAPVQKQAPVQQAPATNVSGSNAAAKQWIASRESGNNYNARNGQFIGMYQLSASYLGGDYSPANQERVANQYVQSRYGSWVGAQQFWQSHGWY